MSYSTDIRERTFSNIGCQAAAFHTRLSLPVQRCGCLFSSRSSTQQKCQQPPSHQKAWFLIQPVGSEYIKYVLPAAPLSLKEGPRTTTVPGSSGDMTVSQVTENGVLNNKMKNVLEFSTSRKGKLLHFVIFTGPWCGPPRENGLIITGRHRLYTNASQGRGLLRRLSGAIPTNTLPPAIRKTLPAPESLSYWYICSDYKRFLIHSHQAHQRSPEGAFTR